MCTSKLELFNIKKIARDPRVIHTAGVRSAEGFNGVILAATADASLPTCARCCHLYETNNFFYHTGWLDDEKFMKNPFSMPGLACLAMDSTRLEK